MIFACGLTACDRRHWSVGGCVRRVAAVGPRCQYNVSRSDHLRSPGNLWAVLTVEEAGQRRVGNRSPETGPDGGVARSRAADLHQSVDLRSSPVAMRPPVGLPTDVQTRQTGPDRPGQPGRPGDPVVPVRRHLRRLALVRRGRLPRGLHHPGAQPDRPVPDRRASAAAAWCSWRCYLAYRSRPVFVPTNEVDPLAPYRTIITTRPKLFAFGISGVVGADLRAVGAVGLDDRAAVAATAATSAPSTRSSATTSASTSSPCR